MKYKLQKTKRDLSEGDGFLSDDEAIIMIENEKWETIINTYNLQMIFLKMLSLENGNLQIYKLLVDGRSDVQYFGLCEELGIKSFRICHDKNNTDKKYFYDIKMGL